MITNMQLLEKVNDEADKQGSDYFSYPLVKERFRKCTLALIREWVKNAEDTQEVVDDLKPIIKIKPLTPIANPDDVSNFICAVPNDYLHKLSGRFIYDNGQSSVKTTFERHAEEEFNRASPFKRPSFEFPLVSQVGNHFIIDTDQVVPKEFKLIYVKIPLFGVGENDPVFDLGEQALEKIVDLVTASFLIKAGDPRSGANYQFGESQK